MSALLAKPGDRTWLGIRTISLRSPRQFRPRHKGRKRKRFTQQSASQNISLRGAEVYWISFALSYPLSLPPFSELKCTHK